MENLYSRRENIHWIRPNMDKEKSEVARTLIEVFGIEPSQENIQVLIDKINSAPIADLSDEKWEQLQNTDSYNIRIGHLEDAINITEEYNKDSARGYQRNAGLIAEAFEVGKEMEAPVIVSNDDNTMHLVSGNTRLMVSRALGITPKVVIVKYK